MSRWLRVLPLLGCLACATPQTAGLRADRGGLPARAAVEGVPFHPQVDAFCGPASLAMVLAWAGDPTPPEALVPLVYSPGREGTLQADLLAGARRRGRVAVPVSGLRSLLIEVSEGHPVLILQNLGLSWAAQWHYGVVIGFDLDADMVYLRSGDEPSTSMTLTLLEHTWGRADFWALVVLPPDRPSATADEPTWIRAVAGLERAGHPAAAATGYATALRRWPTSLAAHMGLGNARHALRDLAGAEAAFAAAARHHPRSGAAFNNLAHVLAELGRSDEALQAARTAVGLGGPGEADARVTLEAILRARDPESSRAGG